MKTAPANSSGQNGLSGWWVLLPITAIICGAFWIFERRNTSIHASSATVPAAQVRGDLITPPPVNSNQPGQVMLFAESSRQKNTPTFSAQQRLVMYQLKLDQLTDEQPINSAPASAQTNLPDPGPTTEPLLPGYSRVGFDKLAGFDFELTEALVKGTPQDDAPPASRIPDDIKQLDGRQVGIRGFLLPVKMDDGQAVEFLLMRDRSFCCYGTPPKINQWITVHVKDRGVKPVMDQVITVYGTLHVGEMRENGFLVGIYALNADKVTGLPD